ncbi:juvenile hormone-binding protein-like [Spodoptera frugiperda]|uniref:Juvenile hormone-binding protein-like n=1 Tax=Spodoptera frugiperda TaxID=7108 RepID=A0A9R0DF25_SPOFR|nr:juvenile hormone-binding protein-like [Spodoptera frugiperda]
MAVYRSLLVLAFAGCVLSEFGAPFEPCDKDDIKCLSAATESFLEKTCNGIPDYDIKAIDPLIIPELKYEVDPDMGLLFEFKNINVTGLKNQQISDFRMDTDKKSVLLKTKAVLNIVGDVKISLTKNNKVFNGVYSASYTALGNSKYGYSLVQKGDLEYFEVGPEVNSCEIIGEPVISLDSSLQNAIDQDADARALKPSFETKKDTLRKNTLCRIVESAYITVIHNLRSSAKIYPCRAFFNGMCK